MLGVLTWVALVWVVYFKVGRGALKLGLHRGLSGLAQFLGNSALGALLHTTGRRATSLAPAHWMPVAALSHDIQNVPDFVPFPWAGAEPRVREHP